KKTLPHGSPVEQPPDEPLKGGEEFDGGFRVGIVHVKSGDDISSKLDRPTLNSSRQRQRKEEGCPLSQFAFHPDLAAVGLDDMFDDGQPQAGAALLARPG